MIPENCTFCGLCCTLNVRLSNKDIKRIEQGSGLKRGEFVVADVDGRPLLKRENGWCTFFRREGKIGMCTIYDSRPDACHDFPGKKMCDLAENPIYDNLTINSENKRIKLLLGNAPTAATTQDEIEKAKREAEKAFTS